MKKTKLPLYEIFSLVIGEIIVSAVICLVYLLLDSFSYKVILGVALGSATAVFNFLYLSIAAGNAFDKALAEIGEAEMSEEEAGAFAEENQAKVQNAIKLSYIIRNIIMIAVLVIAFIVSWFDVIATLIPLAVFRLIITVASLIKRKVCKE